MREPARIQVADATVERAIDEVRRSVVEAARDPFLSGVDLDVTLPDGVEVSVVHGLGRGYTGYSLSAPRGAVAAGYIVETVPDVSRRVLKLTAHSYGATVQVRLRVW